jgi:hypothetical protein
VSSYLFPKPGTTAPTFPKVSFVTRVGDLAEVSVITNRLRVPTISRGDNPCRRFPTMTPLGFGSAGFFYRRHRMPGSLGWCLSSLGHTGQSAGAGVGSMTRSTASASDRRSRSLAAGPSNSIPTGNPEAIPAGRTMLGKPARAPLGGRAETAHIASPAASSGTTKTPGRAVLLAKICSTS